MFVLSIWVRWRYFLCILFDRVQSEYINNMYMVIDFLKVYNRFSLSLRYGVSSLSSGTASQMVIASKCKRPPSNAARVSGKRWSHAMEPLWAHRCVVLYIFSIARWIDAVCIYTGYSVLKSRSFDSRRWKCAMVDTTIYFAYLLETYCLFWGSEPTSSEQVIYKTYTCIYFN